MFGDYVVYRCVIIVFAVVRRVCVVFIVFVVIHIGRNYVSGIIYTVRKTCFLQHKFVVVVNYRAVLVHHYQSEVIAGGKRSDDTVVYGSSGRYIVYVAIVCNHINHDFKCRVLLFHYVFRGAGCQEQ